MLLEFPREHLHILDEDRGYCHPSLRCSCGSDKVFNYGIPKNNGRYFFCRICEKTFETAGDPNKHNRMAGCVAANNDCAS